MAFDSDTRNALARMVADARGLLVGEFTKQLQEVHGIQPTGQMTDLERLTHLDDEQRATAGLLRDRVHHLAAGLQDEGKPTVAAVDRMLREQSFTILNRFAALRMCEERGIVQQCVGAGTNSKGFKVYLQTAGTGLGEQYDRYRTYFSCLFDEIAVDLGVLFDRYSSYGLLFPREAALSELLEILNRKELAHIWSEDEAIGWIYQYFNSKEERQKMRKASAAPRNSRELAVRNQFFTPRYVVQFLVDNTLGRIWCEMRQGDTKLVDQCEYMVRRPNEIFLNEGEEPPTQDKPEDSDLSQEDLLQQPVHIPFRQKKDPREIRVLDPACGSGHFLLYCFDLLETIYEESWDDPDLQGQLRQDFGHLEAFRREIPILILEHNLHGIEIDSRCAQIASLALWLRVQRVFKKQKMSPSGRPSVRRSNIVVAEPMPGDKQMLDEFTASLNPPLLGQIVERVWDSMKLAGEAGSLLKIEEQITEWIRGAKKRWATAPKAEQMVLFESRAQYGSRQEELELDVTGITDERFWEHAEERIYAALQDYAESTEAGDYQRRLFAEDAAHGFAFIDLCRRQYDASVMNPPFGRPAAPTQDYTALVYPKSKHDVAAAFVERWVTHSLNGFLGAITTRNLYYLPTSAEWRRLVGECQGSFDCFADLGFGVLDAAMVEAASIAIRSGRSRAPILFFAHKDTENKEEGLQRDIDHIGRTHKLSANTFAATFTSIQRLDTGSFCYWVSDQVRKLFSSNPSMGDRGFDCRAGLQSNDDFRWLRLWWETPQEQSSRPEWKPYAKGGDFSRYYSDLPLLIDWTNGGSQMKAFIEGRGDSASRYIRSEQMYFREGLTWSQRSQVGLGIRAYPAGSVFGIKGPVLFAHDRHDLLLALSLTNSSIFKGLIALHMSFGSYDTGTVQRNPTPLDLEASRGRLAELAAEQFALVLSVHRREEANHFFSIPSFSSQPLDDWLRHDKAEQLELGREFEERQARIDQAVAKTYGLGTVSQRNVLRQDSDSGNVIHTFSTEEFDVGGCDIVSWMTGATYGRWDIRYATGERQPPELPDPFDPLPVCPPGMLQNADGLPAAPADVPEDYPLRITWPGILVRDDGQSEDIVVRVRDALAVIWGNQAASIEQEACTILGVRALHDYFAEKKSGSKFFKDHLGRYSKSRRQAPIYWPLSTESGSYTLWIYYHRLDDQMLFKCIGDFIEPKIRNVSQDIERLQKAVSAGGAARERDELDQLIDLRQELEGMRAELLRVAHLPYKPDLNDGVIINAAPLWKLFRPKKWRKGCKSCWDKLDVGEYDWAHMAYNIWPDRVREKCRTDKSLAIAHGLENVYEQPPEEPKKKRRSRKAKQVEVDL